MYLIDPAPELWTAEWWIDAGIPMLGAIGSFAVAVAAIYVTWRLARLDRNDRERNRRAAFAVAVGDYLDPRLDDAHRRRDPVFGADNRLFTSAATAGAGATAVARWIVTVEDELFDRSLVRSFVGDGPTDSERERDHSTLVWTITGRVRRWVTTGQMDYSPVDYEPDPNEIPMPMDASEYD
ncbi:hypothetical protein [Microbacterium allomyrinae]|uniref:hypothetical protein n=1 Tax=Microbacterium allomyrinae TaxID=2830666 RepID=UPI001E3F4463|nr:hypothetical protein [Microbacterium allomyrinae]